VILPRGILVLAIVATLSVALNLFLAANQLGHQFRGPPPPPNFEQRLHTLWRDMPAADQPIAQGILDQHYAEIMEKWRQFRPANQHVAQVMHADPFDPIEAKAAVDNANQRWGELRTAMQSMLIEIAQKVSPEGRKHIHAPGGL
jgi:Spy/CpxP family protein refolding chaperone